MSILRLARSTPVCRAVSNTPLLRSYATQARASLTEEYAANQPSTWNGGVERKAQVSTLSNGMRVATLGSNSPVASLGLFVNAGSRKEDRHSAGATQYLKHLVFQSSARRYGGEIQQDVEQTGSTLRAIVGREHLLFASDTTREAVPTMVGVLADAFRPRLVYHEVVRQAGRVEEETERLSDCRVTHLFDLLHQEAYRSRGLGSPLIAPAHNIHHIEPQGLKDYVHQNFTAQNSVIVAVGVDHKEFVDSVQSVFEKVQKEAEAKIAEYESKVKGTALEEKTTSHTPHHAPAGKTKYTGGEALIPTGGDTHVAVAFEGLPLASSPKETAALGVLQYILGSGLQGVNAGHRIGTGVTSRLVSKVLHSKPNYKSVATFNFAYSDSGLFGVYGETDQDAASLVNAMVSEIQGLASKEVNAEELARGKAAYKASLLEKADSQSSALEFLGMQILAARGASSVRTPSEFAADVDAITAADVANIAKRVFATAPTLVASGDVADIPSLAEYTPKSILGDRK